VIQSLDASQIQGLQPSVAPAIAGAGRPPDQLLGLRAKNSISRMPALGRP